MKRNFLEQALDKVSEKDEKDRKLREEIKRRKNAKRDARLANFN